MSGTSGGNQSVERAFALLDVLARSGETVSLSQLAAEVQLPLPTIHRFLRTLLALGCVRQLPDRRYALGAELIRLGNAANQGVGRLAQPWLRRLAEELGESANMAVLDGPMVTYIGQAQSRNSMRMFTEVGRRAPAHATGVGKAMLATLTDVELDKVLGLAGAVVGGGPDRSDLLDELAKVRTVGYAVDDEEQELGVRCFAVAVPGAVTPVGVSVSGPTSRLDDAFAARAVPLLTAAVDEIAAAL